MSWFRPCERRPRAAGPSFELGPSPWPGASPCGAAIAVGTGIQNAPLAIAIALTIVGIEDLAIPAAVFGVTMLFTASGLVLVLRALAPSKASTT